MWHHKDQRNYGLLALATACSSPFAYLIGMALFGFLSYPGQQIKPPPRYLTNPKSAQDYIDRATHYMWKKGLTVENTKQALADCDLAVAIKPNRAWTHHCRVIPLAYLGRKEEAKVVLKKVIVLYKKHGPKGVAAIYENRGFDDIDKIQVLSPSP